jgi:hypothetical protein
MIPSTRVLLIALFMMAFLYGTKTQVTFASENGPRGIDIASSDISPSANVSESPPNYNTIRTLANQQNYCQGNVVICQNILTEFICAEGAVCIVGNMDPFLLVLPY